MRFVTLSLTSFDSVFAELLVSTIVWARAPQYINIVNPWVLLLSSSMHSC